MAVHLQNNMLGIEGTTSLASALLRNSTLTSLNLANNTLRSNGLYNLAEPLNRSHTLKELYVGVRHGASNPLGANPCD